MSRGVRASSRDPEKNEALTILLEQTQLQERALRDMASATLGRHRNGGTLELQVFPLHRRGWKLTVDCPMLMPPSKRLGRGCECGAQELYERWAERNKLS